MPDGTLSGGGRAALPLRSWRVPGVRRLSMRDAARGLVPVIYVGCCLAFLADMQQNNTLAFGVFYIPLVCTAVFHQSPSSVWWLTSVACTLSVIGAFFPNVNGDLLDLIGNRILSIIAILCSAVFVRHARIVQERLAEQTRRAEAAERVKTEVFTNLSQEIRTPLHSMVGLSQLMMANCRDDQRLPLGQVQSAGKRLLGTIENLIDLTQLEDRSFHLEPVDVAAVLRQAADAAHTAAKDRQIALEVDVPTRDPLVVKADAWALRRILDNLLANAVKFSPPGSEVLAAVEMRPNGLAVVVSDQGYGMPPDVLRHIGEPFYQSETSTGTGTGLALSRRLASEMNATLSFDSEAGAGTTVELRLGA